MSGTNTDEYDSEAEKLSIARRYRSGEIDEDTYVQKMGTILMRQSMRVRFEN